MEAPVSRRKLPGWLQSKAKAPSGDSKCTAVETKSRDSCEAHLSVLVFPGKIIYCHIKDECNFICEEMLGLAKVSPLTVGFDIEWKVTYTKGTCPSTAVLQLCPSAKRCYVFHLSAMAGFPVALGRVLEDTRIRKVGVGITGDMAKLTAERRVRPVSVIDLGGLANERLLTNDRWSLSDLLINQHKKRLEKDPVLRCSNWEHYPLTDEQLEYAALDAYASLLVYQSLSEGSSS